MGLFGWLERKIFLGEVVRDYGILDETIVGRFRVKTSALLCRRLGNLYIVFRRVSASSFSRSVGYPSIEVTVNSMENLMRIAGDARAVALAEDGR